MATAAARPRESEAALAVLGLASRELTRLFEAVQQPDWDRPTPCTEWDLRDLAEHITGGNRFTIRILGGDSTEDALAWARRSFSEDRDTRQSLATSLLELEDRFVVPGMLDQICHHVSGDMSGYEVLRLRLHDLIIHTWDAAQVIQATPFDIRPELASWALTDLAADTFAARHFGLELATTGDGEPDQDTLLAAFGRATL